MSKSREHFSDALTRDWIVNKVAAIAGSSENRFVDQEKNSKVKSSDKEGSSSDANADVKAPEGTYNYQVAQLVI